MSNEPKKGPIISLREVEKSFNGLEVFRRLSLDVKRGETLTVIGGSGSGKTVLLKLMIGLLAPDGGKVLFDGRDLTGLTQRELVAVRTRFGMVFQGGALFDSYSVGENVAFPLREHHSYQEQEVRRIVSEKLGQVGLVGVQDKYPAELSGGMKKRVALARALVMDPEVILYDEPTTGLDPVLADTINELIIHTHRLTGATSVVVTHDMVSAYKISQRIVMLYQGQLQADDTPEGIRSSSDPLVRRFIEGRADGAFSQTGSEDKR